MDSLLVRLAIEEVPSGSGRHKGEKLSSRTLRPCTFASRKIIAPRQAPSLLALIQAGRKSEVDNPQKQAPGDNDQSQTPGQCHCSQLKKEALTELRLRTGRQEGVVWYQAATFICGRPGRVPLMLLRLNSTVV
jgi:hypothetical protein